MGLITQYSCQVGFMGLNINSGRTTKVRLGNRLKSRKLQCGNQSCKSGRACRVRAEPKVNTNFGLSLGLRRTFSFRCTKI